VDKVNQPHPHLSNQLTRVLQSITFQNQLTPLLLRH